jgi:hypothetical protein
MITGGWKRRRVGRNSCKGPSHDVANRESFCARSRRPVNDSILLANLALLDIYHGESDVTLEWQVIRVSFLVMIAFHVFVLIAAWKASGLRHSRRT